MTATLPKLFRIRLFAARNFGAYRYRGMISMAGAHGYPLAQVRYKDGYRSIQMAIGTAVDYAKMFDGSVEPVGTGS